MSRILVVEDNEENTELALRFLRRDGHQVLLAKDGKEGVEMATESLPDLILMDLSLPELDGWEATRRIKLNPATAHIPVIALTAHALDQDIQKALAAGCDQYETKPVDFRRLKKKIEMFVRT